MFMAGKDEIPINNGAVLNISQIIWAVMSSAAEAELGALFIYAKNSSFNAKNADQTWTSAAPHPDANQKRNSTRTTHQQNSTKSTQGHGHVLPLATVSRFARPISLLLATWNAEPGRLLH